MKGARVNTSRFGSGKKRPGYRESVKSVQSSSELRAEPVRVKGFSAQLKGVGN